MTARWKLSAETELMDPVTPAVLTTGMLQAIAMTGRPDAPSMSTFQRWMHDLVDARKIVEVTKGIYLNRLGHRDISSAAAACTIRARAFVSLTWVLEQAGLTNNFGDTVTCVIPIAPGWTNPQISDRKTRAGTFRFFAMPARLVHIGGPLDDYRDLRYDYERASPEKALADMIYLGASPRSRMTRPPFDIDTDRLNRAKLKRIARRMEIAPLLEDWFEQRSRYQADPDVRDNVSALLA